MTSTADGQTYSPPPSSPSTYHPPAVAVDLDPGVQVSLDRKDSGEMGPIPLSSTPPVHEQIPVRAIYQGLVTRRTALQEERANCELDLKQFALHPKHYNEEQLTQIRERYHRSTADLDRVVREIDSLVADHPALRRALEQEWAGAVQAQNGNGDHPEASAEKS